MHALIESWAAREPDRLAVSSGNERLSYGELNRRANQLARGLRRSGAGVETTVALLMERSVEMLVSFLAVLKSGAAAVLLDPAHPEERLRQSCRETGAVLVLSVARLGRRTGSGLAEFHVDADWNRVQQESESDLGVAVHPENLAYVIHTSGSTGTPKRVAVTHRSIAHSVLTHRAGHRITPEDRASWLAPPGASVSVGELWPYLTSGASVHAAPSGVGADPGRLRDWLVELRISKAFVSMPVAELLFDLPWPDDAALRLLTIGSDRVRRWASAQLPFEVAVACGSSEANGISSCLVPWSDRVTSATATAAQRSAVPPVGRAWPDVRLHVLDAGMRPVPPGGIGELYVGGPELSRGYLGAARETASRFVPDPFTGPGQRLYRSGDLVRIDGDGLVYHHGRTDHEVRIRGFRVDPAEAELALLAVPGIRSAVVVPTRHPDGETVLAAYVVGRLAGRPAELRDALALRLPSQLIPAAFTVLEALPLNANHKVDRARLPEPDWSALSAARYVAPRDALERDLAEIWAEVLGIADIGVHDHFFELGGNSLSGTRAVTRIGERLGARVRLRDLLRHATPEDLAAHLRDRMPVRPTTGR